MKRNTYMIATRRGLSLSLAVVKVDAILFFLCIFFSRDLLN